MLRVLQHYLPLRTLLLVASESLLLFAILATGMAQHLWDALAQLRDANLLQELAREGLSVQDARYRCLVSSGVLTVLCQISIGFNQLYDFRTSNSRYERAARFVESTGTALALVLVAVYAAHFLELRGVLDFPGLRHSQRVQTLVVSMVTGFAVLYLWRNVYHWALRKVKLNQRVLILGSLRPARSLTREILDHPEAGYEVVGLVPEVESGEPRARPALLAEPEGNRADSIGALVLDSYVLTTDKVENRGVAMAATGNGDGSLLGLAEKLAVDELIVAIEDRRRTLPTQDLLRCRMAGVEVREREDVYEEITGKLAVEAMRPSYLIFNPGFRRHRWASVLKRVVDVTCALVILAVMWPVMLLCAVVVRLDSPGPSLFRQDRVGQNGKRFTLLKFRSMRADAERHTGPVWSSKDDPRITRWGRFMRRTRFDELPQLFNVLGGSMSLVGPRPERQHFVDDLAAKIPYYHQRHIVKPGVTGWAQINYPYGNTVEDALHKLQYDLFYIKNQSLLFDLSILFNTIKTVVLRQGT